MKRFAKAAICIAALAGLAACATQAPAPSSTSSVPGSTTTTLTPAQQAQAAVAQVATTVNKYCPVAQPFLLSLATMQTDPTAIAELQVVTADANRICAAASVVLNPPVGTAPVFDIASVQTFVDKEVPTLLGIVKSSNLNAQQKSAAELAITGGQLALSIAVANAK